MHWLSVRILPVSQIHGNSSNPFRCMPVILDLKSRERDFFFLKLKGSFKISNFLDFM